MRPVWHPSPNRAPRPAGARPWLLVVHYTGMVDAAAAVARLCDRRSSVSAHYVVLEDGHVLQLVDEAEIAWHAGVSAWRGRSGLNAVSIGIEVVNGGHDFGLPPYAPVQIDAVARLAAAIVRRWRMSPVDVVAHSDVAPMRKCDPGERFPWARLAAAGVGLWPTGPVGEASSSITCDLQRIGYVLEGAPQPTTTSAALAAFQRRFMPTHPIDGRSDEPTTRRRLAQVASSYALAAEARGD